VRSIRDTLNSALTDKETYFGLEVNQLLTLKLFIRQTGMILVTTGSSNKVNRTNF